jgi:CDP-diacylglycerol--serine O-phosphatidyltransferase
MQLDSLADVITFGVAPAALIYKWGLAELPYPAGLVISFAFVATAAVRLARFNVLSTGEAAPGKFILGLTVPAASSILVALVIINVRMGGVHAIAQSPIAVLVLTL